MAEASFTESRRGSHGLKLVQFFFCRAVHIGNSICFVFFLFSHMLNY
jgi:hypothetical protein